jgi:hypothetical protein
VDRHRPLRGCAVMADDLMMADVHQRVSFFVNES